MNKLNEAEPGFVMLTVDEYQAKYANVITLNDDMRYGYECLYHELTASPAAPSTEASEPVAWVRFCGDGLYEGPVMNCDKAGMENVRHKLSEWTPLYTTPPPAPVLSDAEIIAIRKAQVGRYGSAGPAPYADSIQFARAIEQAIGRKGLS